ncbi:protoporphyrinogen oxidase [bacterium]|nr:protoporphyrinogen oxidase [bacterium]
MQAQQPRRIAILGAGITGLVAALKLAQRGHQVTLIERASRLGGVIQSVREDGWLREIGPNSFTSSPHLDALTEELGLGAEMLATPLKDHDRFVWKAGRLRCVPTGPGELLKTDVLSTGEKLRLLFGLVKRYDPPTEDLPLASFFRSVLGPGVVESLLKPFLAGVYAADGDRVSFEATFNKLWVAVRGERRLISALKAMRRASPKPDGPRKPRALVSFRDGLETLPRGLEKAIRAAGVQVITDRDYALSRSGDGWSVELAGTEPIPCDQVVLACSAERAGRLLAPHAKPLADWLHSIEYAALTVVHVGAPEDAFRDKRRGFGFLSVADQGIEALGMIWNDRMFPGRTPPGGRILTCFYGGEKRAETNRWSDERLVQALRADLATVLGHDGRDFDLLRITRWERALPVFRVGHRVRQNQAMRHLPPGVHLAGNFLGGVSIPDRVEAAIQLAKGLTGD